MNAPRRGEIPFKQWAAETAREAGVTARAIMGRYYAGKIRLRVRRVNQRVVYVQQLKRAAENA